MGTNYYVVKNRPSVNGRVEHIGKSSWGWLFLFHTVSNPYAEPPMVWHSYGEVMDWLKEYTTGEHPEFIIMNEYDEVVPFEDFKGHVDAKQGDEHSGRNPHNFDYCENVEGYRFEAGDFS